jgi:hypothetical protein
MNQRPLVYYWKAIYKDDTYLSQYDEDNFEVNTFEDIDKDKLDKLELLPFSKNMEKGLINKNIIVRSIPFLPTYSIKMLGGRRPIYFRDVFISHEEFHKCDNCNKEFSYSLDSPKIEGKYPSPICPHCQSHDYFYCKVCDKKYIFEETANGLCPKCKNHLERRRITSKKYTREKRWIEYIIGAQETINGRNTQFKLRIDEYGNCNVE